MSAKKLSLHLHAPPTCDACAAEGRRDGEIRGLLRAARNAERIAKTLRDDEYYILVKDWCRREASRLRGGKR